MDLTHVFRIARASTLLCRAPALLLVACGLHVLSCRTATDSAGSSNGSSGDHQGSVHWPSDQDSAAASEDASVNATEAGTECTTDQDCVAEQCCHPTSCVLRAHRPVCGEVMCSTDCRAGTMDCGGGCLCQQGRCAAQIHDRGLSGLFVSDAGAAADVPQEVRVGRGRSRSARP
jgi:hypothetical protein